MRGVGPEVADPLGSFEVGEHEDVEQLGAGSRAESVESLMQSALKLVGTHLPSDRLWEAAHGDDLARPLMGHAEDVGDLDEAHGPDRHVTARVASNGSGVPRIGEKPQIDERARRWGKAHVLGSPMLAFCATCRENYAIR